MSISLVIGASGAIGAALVSSLRHRDPSSTIFATSRLPIALPDADAVFQLDYANPQTFADVAEKLAPHGQIDTVIVATGLLHNENFRPEKALKDIDPTWMHKNFEVNTIGPALALRYFLPLQPRNRPTYFGILSARVGSISDNRLGGWHSYRASKAALNMIVRGAAIEQARKNAQAIVVALHPGTVDSGLSQPFQSSATTLFKPAFSAQKLLGVLEKLQPSQSGQQFDFDGVQVPA